MGISDFWTLASHGGFSMAVIMVFSVGAAAVAIERALALWGLSQSTRHLSESVVKSLYRGEVAQAQRACENAHTPFAELLLAAFSRLGKARPEAIYAAVDRERVMMGMRLRTRLWILATIGATSPFIGLFGTVVGIMKAFKDMAAHPGGGFAVVASGISEALIATAAGIGVAIQAVILFNYFNSRIATLSLTMKVSAEEVLELLFLDRQAETEEPQDQAEVG